MGSGQTVTMKDVAALAGVSQSTVSRVVNSHPSITEEVCNAVTRAMDELGYKAVPYKKAAGPARPVIGLIMCPLPEQKNPLGLSFFGELVTGIQRVAEREEAEIMLISLPINAKTLTFSEERLSRFSGFIVVNNPTDELLQYLKFTRIPFVIAATGSHRSCHEFCDSVVTDNIGSHTMACQYLLQRNIRRFGVFISRQFEERLRGIQIELLAHNLTLDPADCYILESTENRDYVKAINDYLKKGKMPKAIFVEFYPAALVIRQVLENHKIKVPEDVIIFTFTHEEQNDFPYVREFPQIQGEKAVHRLFDKIRHNDDYPHYIIVPVQLIDNHRR